MNTASGPLPQLPNYAGRKHHVTEEQQDRRACKASSTASMQAKAVQKKTHVDCVAGSREPRGDLQNTHHEAKHVPRSASHMQRLTIPERPPCSARHTTANAAANRSRPQAGQGKLPGRATDQHETNPTAAAAKSLINSKKRPGNRNQEHRQADTDLQHAGHEGAEHGRV